jgi:hypothetical protein
LPQHYSLRSTEKEKTKTERRYMSIQEINRIKNHYPAGMRIELISMDDPFAPVPSGTPMYLMLKGRFTENTAY